MQAHEPKIRWDLIVLACMYVGYAALILCRTTVVVAGPAMLDDPALSLDKEGFGELLALGMAGTLIGKLATGVLADRFGGRAMFLFAVALTLAATGFFGLSSGILFFSFAYFVALFAKSGGWPAMANLIGAWYPKTKHGRVWGILSTSSRASSVTATLLLGSLLFVADWRWLFATAGIVAALVLVVLFFFLKRSPSSVGLPPPDQQDDAPAETEAGPVGEALLRFVRSARVWLICVSLMCLTVQFEFQSFIAIYLKETFALSAGAAATASSAFPVGCLVSVLLGGFMFDKLSKRARVFVLGGMMLFSVACIATLIVVPKTALGQSSQLAVTLAAIVAFGIAISPSYYLPMSVFSIEFGGRNCGLLVGIIDAFGYLAAMVFDLVAGSAAEHGWESFLNILLAVSVAATLVVTLFLYLDYRLSAQSPADDS